MATLWVIATPIGNLDDISLRATRILAEVPRVLCEDTRRTRHLLDHLGIEKKPLVRFDAHKERESTDEVLAWLQAGEDLALVSDAGTPVVNDPGERLIRQVAEAGHKVSPVPGPSALIAALSASGLGGDGFSFGGFLPKTEGALLKKLKGLSVGTWVFFVPARDLLKALGAMAKAANLGHIVIAREMTKIHESFYRGEAKALLAQLKGDEKALLGEAVLVFQVKELELSEEAILLELEKQFEMGKSTKVAVDTIAKAMGLSKKWVYQLALKQKEG